MLAQTPQRASDVESLFRLHEVALGRFLLGMVGDLELAEDLLQDTFASACRWPARLAEAATPEAWLFGVARHHALSALHRRYRSRAALWRVAARERPEPMVPTSTREGVELLAPLAPDDRALVLLRYWYGFTAADIATITSRSPATVRKRLERCRTILAARLDRTGEAR
jgi:RNA polymerase sigma-70 factor (ECF subfamily)